MREISLIVIHCSASRCDRDFPFAALDRYHRSLGWNGCGYHYYVTKDGRIHVGRRESEVGAHAAGYNAHSIGICYEGGLDPKGQPADTRTEAQKQTIRHLLDDLLSRYKGAEVLGHRDLPKVHKACPCYDVRAELKSAGIFPGQESLPENPGASSPGRKNLPPIRGRPLRGRNFVPEIRGRPSPGRKNVPQIRGRPSPGRENVPEIQGISLTGRKITNQFQFIILWQSTSNKYRVFNSRC